MVRVKALDACDSKLDAVAYKTTVAAFEFTEQSIRLSVRTIGSLARIAATKSNKSVKPIDVSSVTEE